MTQTAANTAAAPRIVNARAGRVVQPATWRVWRLRHEETHPWGDTRAHVNVAHPADWDADAVVGDLRRAGLTGSVSATHVATITVSGNVSIPRQHGRVMAVVDRLVAAGRLEADDF